MNPDHFVIASEMAAEPKASKKIIRARLGMKVIVFGMVIEEMKQKKWVIKSGKNYQLTAKGMRALNQFAGIAQ